MLPLHLVILGGPWMAWPQLPPSPPLCSMAKVPKSNSTPYHMGRVQLLLIPQKQVSVCWQPAIYSNKSITFSHENQGSPSPLGTTSHLHTAPGCSLYSWAQPLCGSPLCSVSSRPWAVRTCNQWTSTSVDLICPMLDVVCSNSHITLWWESPSH